jgi:hypothetical protein
MGWSGSRARSGGVVLVATLFLAAAGAGSAPQGASDDARPPKSVYGKLQRVDKVKDAVFMKSDAGENLAWRFDKRVIAEAAAFQPGDPMIVIYRLLPKNVKRVTALAFPGKEQTPTYVNLTGSRVVLRSAPAVDGACEKAGGGSVTESVIPEDGRAEAMEACWCCTVAGQTCSPTTKTGVGRAFLVQCFE